MSHQQGYQPHEVQSHQQQQRGASSSEPNLLGIYIAATTRAPGELPVYSQSAGDAAQHHQQPGQHLQAHPLGASPALGPSPSSSQQGHGKAYKTSSVSPFQSTLAERRGHAAAAQSSQSAYSHGQDAQQKQRSVSQAKSNATASTTKSTGRRGKGAKRVDPRDEDDTADDDWSQEEDDRLRAAIATLNKANASTGASTNITASNSKSWVKIASIAFPGGQHTKEECISRWRALTKPPSIKGPWSQQEDDMLQHLVDELGPEKWVAIAQRLGSRSGKQCRERWHNHINPDIRKGPFTPEEDSLILRLFTEVGSKWAYIAKYMPGRTDNAIKNHYNTVLVRRAKLIAAVTSLKDKGLDVPVALQMQADQLAAQQRQHVMRPLISQQQQRQQQGGAGPSRSAVDAGRNDVKKLPTAKPAHAASSSTKKNGKPVNKPPPIHISDGDGSHPLDTANTSADDSALFFDVQSMQLPMGMPMSMAMAINMSPAAVVSGFLPAAPASAPPTVTSFAQAAHAQAMQHHQQQQQQQHAFHGQQMDQHAFHHQQMAMQQRQQQQQQQMEADRQHQQRQRQAQMQLQFQEQLEANRAAAAAGFLDATFDMHDDVNAMHDPYGFMTSQQQPPPPPPAPAPVGLFPIGQPLGRSASLSVPGPHGNLHMSLGLGLDMQMHPALFGHPHSQPLSPDPTGAFAASHGHALLQMQMQMQQQQQHQQEHEAQLHQQQEEQQRRQQQDLQSIQWPPANEATQVERASSAPAYGVGEDVFGSHPIQTTIPRSAAAEAASNMVHMPEPNFAFQFGDLPPFDGALASDKPGRASDAPAKSARPSTATEATKPADKKTQLAQAATGESKAKTMEQSTAPTSSPIVGRGRSRSVLSAVQATPRSHAAVSSGSALRARSGSINSTPRPSLPTPSRISPISSYQAKTGSARALPPLDSVDATGDAPNGVTGAIPVPHGRQRVESLAASTKLLSTALASSDGTEAGIANATLAMRGVDEEQKDALLPAFSHESSGGAPAGTAQKAAATPVATKKRPAEQDLGSSRGLPRAKGTGEESGAPASASTVASTLIPSPRDEHIDLTTYPADLECWDPSKWAGGEDHSRLLSESWWNSLKTEGGLGLSFQPQFSNPMGLHARALSAIRDSPRATKDTL